MQHIENLPDGIGISQHSALWILRILALWLETDDAAGNVGKVIDLIESEGILENDLTKAAVVYISEEDCAELKQCQKVYPEN